MPPKIRAAFITFLLLVALFFHLAVVWQDVATLACNGFLYDDSFYAFKIAQNIAEGRGMTFDGVHPTNGFQPLYVFFLVPIFFFAGDNLALPIYVALSLLTVITLFTAYLLYRISRRYVGHAASLIAALIWTFSPVVTRQSANGLETALATFMIALCVLYYLEKVRSVPHPSNKHFITLGLLLGVAVLSRIDNIFLALVILLDYLLVLRRRGESSRILARLSLIPVGILMVYGPWLLCCVIGSGSPLQDSGLATRFLSLAYAPNFGYGTSSLSVNGPDLTFIWAHLAHSLSVLKTIPLVHVIFRSIEKLGIYVGAQGMFHLAGNIMGYLLLFVFGLAVFRWNKDKTRRFRNEISFLLLFSFLLLVSYTFYIFGAFFFLRYYYPIFMVACIYCAFLVQDVIVWLPRRSLMFRRFAIAGLAVYVITFSYFSYSQAFRSQPVYPFYDVAEWVKTHTDNGEKIGVFQCGTIGYFSERTIINLDGKVNRDAFNALKEGCIEDYLREEGINVVVDHSNVIDLFFRPSFKERADVYMQIPCSHMNGSSGWVAVRFNSDSESIEARDVTGSVSSASGVFFAPR